MIDETHGLFRGAGYLTHDGPIAALFGRIAALKLWQPWRTVNSRLTQTVRCHNCWPRKAHPCDRAVVFPSCGASERVKALNELHAQKVRALMKSVNSLKAKITKMTRDNKQNKLAVRIQGMQKQHREMELVVDVLKQMMCERQWSRAEVRRSAAAVAGLFRFAFGVHVAHPGRQRTHQARHWRSEAVPPENPRGTGVGGGFTARCSPRGAASDGCVRVSCGVAWVRARSCNN